MECREVERELEKGAKGKTLYRLEPESYGQPSSAHDSAADYAMRVCCGLGVAGGARSKRGGASCDAKAGEMDQILDLSTLDLALFTE
jgi:hypothetical protein